MLRGPTNGVFLLISLKGWLYRSTIPPYPIIHPYPSRMLLSSRCIVLHTLRYGDNAIIAHVLTEAAGCLTYIIRVTHARRARSPHMLFQPFALLDIAWEDHPRASMQRPKSVSVATPLVSIPYEMGKRGIALYLAEFLYHALRSEPASPSLFAYIYHSIEWLDATRGSVANFHLVFLLRLTRFLGLFPEVRTVVPGTYFDLETCAFSALKPAHPHFLTPEEAVRLPLLLRMRYETMHLFHLSAAERSRFLDLVGAYYQLHCPGFPELKSLQVLRQLGG